MSEWTKWSSVDASGTVFRYRYVLRPALNGGKACEDLLQLKKGTLYIIENSLKSYQFIWTTNIDIHEFKHFCSILLWFYIFMIFFILKVGLFNNILWKFNKWTQYLYLVTFGRSSRVDSLRYAMVVLNKHKYSLRKINNTHHWDINECCCLFLKSILWSYVQFSTCTRS